MCERDIALLILKDLSKDMRPSTDLFGNGTLVIDRDKFEAIRKKYLDDDLDYENELTKEKARVAELIARNARLSYDLDYAYEVISKLKGDHY